MLKIDRLIPVHGPQLRRLLLAVVAILLLGGSTRAASPSTRPAADSPWEKEIASIETRDRATPPPQGGVLFAGSSSIRMWSSLPQDFPDVAVVNHAFGGSEIRDSTFFADRIILPCRPKLIVLGAGSNDIHAGMTPAEVLEEFKQFVAKARAILPETKIAFLEINPAPSRWAEHEKVQEANRLIHDFVTADKDLDYIPLYDALVGPDGNPRRDLFAPDMLHPNAAGYKVRADAVRPHLTGYTSK